MKKAAGFVLGFLFLAMCLSVPVQAASETTIEIPDLDMSFSFTLLEGDVYITLDSDPNDPMYEGLYSSESVELRKEEWQNPSDIAYGHRFHYISPSTNYYFWIINEGQQALADYNSLSPAELEREREKLENTWLAYKDNGAIIDLLQAEIIDRSGLKMIVISYTTPSIFDETIIETTRQYFTVYNNTQVTFIESSELPFTDSANPYATFGDDILANLHLNIHVGSPIEQIEEANSFANAQTKGGLLSGSLITMVIIAGAAVLAALLVLVLLLYKRGKKTSGGVYANGVPYNPNNPGYPYQNTGYSFPPGTVPPPSQIQQAQLYPPQNACQPQATAPQEVPGYPAQGAYQPPVAPTQQSLQVPAYPPQNTYPTQENTSQQDPQSTPPQSR